jgi:glycosyltransferase involved in cell wall biosynthesis
MHKRRLTVLFLASSYPRHPADSASVFLRDLADHLARESVQIHVLAPGDGAYGKDVEGSVSVHRFRYWPGVRQQLAYGSGILPNLKRSPLLWLHVPFFVIAMTVKMCRLLAAERIDLIHAHWLLPQGLVGLIGARLFGVPLIVSAHGSDAFALRGRFLAALKRWIVRRSNHWTANTTETAGAVARDVKLPPPRIIPMGVDVALFSRGDRTALRQAISDREFIVLFVGRLVENKGCRDLIETLSLLREETRSRARLWIVGDGDERDRLQRAAHDLGIEARTEFFGAVEHRRLVDFYAAADLVVVPSKAGTGGEAEGQNVVVLEAFAARACVVATRLGGIPSMVRDQETGVLVEPGNPRALAEAVESLLKDADLRRSLSANAFAEVSKYDWRRVAGQFRDLYQEAVKARVVASGRAADKA